jgi:GNAT superfamily N-acetyltransferase
LSADCVCREIAFRSNEYAEEVRLRDAVLRKPLGIAWTSEELAAELKARHVGCFLHDRLVGTLILTPQNADTVRLRQMAVAPSQQHRGVGTRLIAFAESRATELGYREIVAHARREAAEFYLRLGYSVRGAEFLEVTIPHIEIFKRLGSALEFRGAGE